MIRLGEFRASRDNSRTMKSPPAISCHASDASLAPLRCEAASPGRIALQLLCTGCCLALAAALALPADRTIARWITNHPLPGELPLLVELSEIFGWGGGAAIIILTAARLDLRGWKIVSPLAIGSLGAGLVTNGVKLLIARTRPSATQATTTVLDTFVAYLPLLQRDQIGGGYGYHVQSFPSAHSATAAGLAIALSSLYPRGRWLFGVFATLAMVQRLEAQAHYCSDILAGAAVAFFVASFYNFATRSFVTINRVPIDLDGCSNARGKL